MRPLIHCAAILISILPLGAARAEGYRDAKPLGTLFDHNELGLMAIEREKLASELAAYVSNELGRGPRAEGIAAGAGLELASRMLAVALQLHPRNRIALITNFKLGRGLHTELVSSDYEPEVLAEYLYTRSKLLVEQGGEPNDRLAAYLLAFAVEIDPTNEDAIYDLELRDVDGRPPDWERLFQGSPAPVPEAAPAGAAPAPEPSGADSAIAPTAPEASKKEVSKPAFKGWPLGEQGGAGPGPVVKD